MYKTHFLPSPRALRIILALSDQESTIQWNPKLNKEKKQLLRARFHRILSKLKNSLPGSVSTIILAKEHKVKLEERINELNKITDPSNDKIREYDFYLWSRETNLFIHELVVEYKRALEVGQWFVDLGSFLNQLEKEPQTFGLWQINVNHLVEKVKTFHQLRRIFPEIYKQTTNGYIIDRDLLIKALSGRKDSPLSRRKTLELIILTHLKPRYRNHHQGDKMDLVYFVAENMAGEMSTYRASIQHELNLNLRAHLVTDGDLYYYLPHSTYSDWSKKSNTMKKLEAFVAKHHYYFRSPVNPKKLIKELCEADSWLELKDLELYQKIIRSDKPVRRFPQIESKLYHQTPLQYSKTVLKKSRLF